MVKVVLVGGAGSKSLGRSLISFLTGPLLLPYSAVLPEASSHPPFVPHDGLLTTSTLPCRRWPRNPRRAAPEGHARRDGIYSLRTFDRQTPPSFSPLHSSHDINIWYRKTPSPSGPRLNHSTSDPPKLQSTPSDLRAQGVHVVENVDYSDKAALTGLLEGVDTVLSFVVAASDPDGAVQKNLIDAAVAAGVRRFAPSEWAT